MTKIEMEWQRDVRSLGCICCLLHLHVHADCDLHHILSGGRRKGEMFVLPLCPSHHRAGLNGEIFVSRHPWKSRFEAKYGSEASLLVKTRALVADRRWMAA